MSLVQRWYKNLRIRFFCVDFSFVFIVHFQVFIIRFPLSNLSTEPNRKLCSHQLQNWAHFQISLLQRQNCRKLCSHELQNWEHFQVSLLHRQNCRNLCSHQLQTWKHFQLCSCISWPAERPLVHQAPYLVSTYLWLLLKFMFSYYLYLSMNNMHLFLIAKVEMQFWINLVFLWPWHWPTFFCILGIPLSFVA